MGALHDCLFLFLYLGVVVDLCNSIVCHLSAHSTLCHANKAAAGLWVTLDWTAGWTAYGSNGRQDAFC